MGAGPAGLALAYYAKQHGFAYTIYDAAPQVGGNCITYEKNGFRFDSGAHRLHVKDESLSTIYKELLGDDLLAVDAPSAIFYNGKFIDFPLSPLDLLSKLGWINVAKATLSLLKEKLKRQSKSKDFEAYAINTYGKYLADIFLLHYTEKLWGRPANQLSSAVSGARLKGLDLATFLKETFAGKRSKTRHIDGIFLYPKFGIGQLMERLEEYLGGENIHKNACITKLLHEGKRINTIEINGKDNVETDLVISTLPLNLLPQLTQPSPPENILSACKSIAFRHVALFTFLIDKPSVSPHATIYFTTIEWLFTRVVEPRNRSHAMSPKGKTSLVVEVPIDEIDYHNTSGLQEQVIEQLIKTGLIKSSEIIDTDVKFIPNAYPILEIDLDERRDLILNYLSNIENLYVVGRNASFSYTHIHDQFIAARKIIEELVSERQKQ